MPQVVPHAPQFCGSDVAFTHWLPHFICPAAQVSGPGPPVGLLPTLPWQPTSGSATKAIASAAKNEKFEVFIRPPFTRASCYAQ